ncbi:O-methyltransferase [Tamaricihabitans halophyticus]|uniref:O-methyltransferase n=2 Tax=Tamaricihabitans halophyticus TaxID=1262583 RepID=A0A4R2R2K4_9PSEU|nr:O-methyltransferase [Tamaricihabitans halophyticus]
MRATRGFMDAQIVGAFARLGLPELLAGGPVGLAELAVRLGADVDALSRFLRSAVTIGVVGVDEAGCFVETPMTVLLRPGPRSLANFVLTYTDPGMFRPWEQLDNVVRSGHNHTESVLGSDLWEYYRQHEDISRMFGQTMGEQSEFAADVALDRMDLMGPKRFVDVGGSHGVLVSRVLEKNPEATGVLFDLPEVIERARGYVADRGLTDRVELVPGSFLENVPTGGDMYLLKSVLCDWDDEHCVRILSNIRQAAGPDTPVVVLDWLRSAEPTYFMDVTSLGLLVLTDGKVRDEGEFRELFGKAGFDVKRIETATDSWLQITLFELVQAS